MTVHVPGMDNVMANIASRPAKAQKLFHMPSPLSDSKFCSAFDTTYPLPDNQLWTLAATPPWVRYNVFKMLRGNQLALRQWTGPSMIATGKHGRPTVPFTTTPPTARKRQNPSQTSSSCLLLREGKYGLGATVKVQSVKRALRHIAPKLVLDGHPNPRKTLPAQQQLDLPISWLLKSF